jgi:tetratricopeptide (TPR) repeat protein
MALFGFNKQKVLASAEKYVQQGKLQNAIAEYEKILKNDPKDLTVTNTVGDLYSRIGESDKATECFKSVGDAYATQGFTVKAIAMYKKISKLKPSLDSLLKLAELYTQQGLLNDARAQYQQIADEFQKAGEWENAARIYQKILEMDPENGKMRVQLAEVYVRLGKKADAWQIFTAAAESMRAKGSLSGAEEILQRMLTLDPGNNYALLMQGKNLLESGDAAAAAASLQKVPDIDSNPDGLRDLLKAYLQTGQLSEAGTAASKLLTIHNDLSAISSFADALMQAGQYENALQVFDQHAERLLAENSEKVLNHLHAIIGHVRENPDSLEKLLELFNKAGETTHVSEVLELLAHASVQSGDLTRARDLYQKLAQIEPQNPLHMQNYQQVVSRLGGTSGTKLITPEEAVVLIDDLEATAPAVHQHYSDEVSLAVRSALTDAELFISYNMPAKALGPLLTALPLAPRDLRINQRLAALHTRAGRFAEAAVCCRTLQALYSEAEYPDEATRYGELAERYEERSATPAMAPEEETHVFLDSQPLDSQPLDSQPVDAQAGESGEVQEEIQIAEPEFSVDAGSGEESATESQAEISHPSPVTEAAWPAASTHTAEEMAVTPAEPEVPELTVSAPDTSGSAAEIDLSSEWDDTVTVEASVEASATEEAETIPAAAEQASADEVQAGADRAEDSVADPKTEETIEEIRFYIAHGMPEQAMATLARLQTLTSDHGKLDEIRSEVEAAVEAAQQARAQQSSAGAAKPVSEEFTVEEITADEIPSAELDETVVEEAAEVEEPVAQAQAAKVEVPVAEPTAIEASVEPEAEPAKPETPHGVLSDFVSDLESSLGDNFLAGKPAGQKKPEPPPPVASKPAAAPAKVVSAPAARVIGKFVADLEAGLGEDFPKSRPVPEAPATRAAKPAAQPPAVGSKPAAAVPAPVAKVEIPLVASAAASASSAAPSAPQPSASVAWAPAAETLAPAAPIAHPPAAPAASKESPFGEEAGVDLAEMFGELKQDLEAGVTASEEDPETHYNLGIAFREMGLLDEAIGELQKACQSFDRGHPFPQVMQTYTWLAQCFLDKGVPEAAVRWYQKALGVPTIDGETRVALNYELASAHETAGDKASALKHFMEVYGSNIDYRDVAERIQALKS